MPFAEGSSVDLLKQYFLELHLLEQHFLNYMHAPAHREALVLQGIGFSLAISGCIGAVCNMLKIFISWVDVWIGGWWL